MLNRNIIEIERDELDNCRFDNNGNVIINN